MSRMLGNTSREKLFFFLMLLIPILFLAGLELGLRVVGFGGDYPLFIESTTLPGALEANPEAARRYMMTTGAPFSAIEPFPFRKTKLPDAYRIVVQGGSSAAGYPYGRWGGLAGMLGDRLRMSFPERETEVITTAMSAVNSYTLTDFAEEIVAIEPDAVLIYAGHNEYVGVLGVGSALTPSSSQFMVQLQLELRRLRLYQLLEWGMAQAKVAIRVLGNDDSSFFAKVASGAQIDYDSETYRAGIDQFETNLDSLLSRYADAGIDVYIGTLVSNEKDLFPFSGKPGEKIDRGKWSRLMEQQRSLREAGHLVAARAAVEQLLELDQNAAEAWFALGRLELASDRFQEARAAFIRARDLDRLRFRAPSDFQVSIRDLAERHGAKVVEVEAHLREAAPDGIFGRELLLEHVHPNSDGYFLLADAFYEALRRDAVIGNWHNVPTREEAHANMPLTEIDRLLGHYDLLEMIAGPPFTDQAGDFKLPKPQSEVEKLAQKLWLGDVGWLQAQEALLELRLEQGRTRKAARVARQIAHTRPSEYEPNFTAGTLLLKLEQYAWSRWYLQRALQAAPESVSTRVALIKADLKLGDEESAARRLKWLEQFAPDHPLLKPENLY